MNVFVAPPVDSIVTPSGIMTRKAEVAVAVVKCAPSAAPYVPGATCMISPLMAFSVARQIVLYGLTSVPSFESLPF